MDKQEYQDAVEEGVELQGTERYYVQALEELGYQYADDVPERAWDFVVERAEALYQENES